MTIVAVVTPPVSSGVGILRLSGPAALRLAAAVSPGLPAEPQPRHAYLTAFVDGSGEVLDEGLLLYFRAPHSFTGEEVVELQTHGSPKLLELLLAAVLNSGEARLAEPGEFTRRAFLNGRIDLTRAEAIADLVNADSLLAVRSAAAQLRGELSNQLAVLRRTVVDLQAELEGVLNFPDEAADVRADWGERLSGPIEAVRALLSQEHPGRLLRRGARVVLFGPVNAGKSTLFNRLAGAERALVDAAPGTTRDLVEARWEVGGCAVTLVDTAGLREGAERVEAMGIARARGALANADLALMVLPAGTVASEQARWALEADQTPWLRVVSKMDRVVSDPSELGQLFFNGLSGEGLDSIQRSVSARLGLDLLHASSQIGARHAEGLHRALVHLEGAARALRVSTLEVVAGEVGLAAESLGELTGENASEALLDAIFRRFCIGK